MNQYRVTKYDPTFRDASGAYTRQDWTSFSDIGRAFGDITLSREEYLRVESAYVDIAMRFLAEDGARSLRVVEVENHGGLARAPKEGDIVSGEELAAVCSSILRDEYWCRLEADGRYLHFGYDFYLYVGVKNQCAGSIQAAHGLGLFVEEFASPYLEEKPEPIQSITDNDGAAPRRV
jgi:hypothetical protein